MGTFSLDRLDPSARIFVELESGNHLWWETLRNDRQFICEVRKDNQVNIYFEGGSVARIHYCSRHKVLQAFTHRKYLDLDKTHPMYVDCAPSLSSRVGEIVERIKTVYSRKKGCGKEAWSEKYIQSHLIINNRDRYIDSEFAYKDEAYDIRVDLVELVGGELRFVELKRIGDSRMLLKTEDNPEIIFQLREYERFIGEYGINLLAYYSKLYDLKKSLKLPVPPTRPTSICPRPFLLIFNNWEKPHPSRKKHTARMERILQREGVDYSIIDGFDLASFENKEKKRQLSLVKNGFFGETRFGGPWTIRNGHYKKVLHLPYIMHPDNSANNLFRELRNDALAYFEKNGIEWWNQSEGGYCPPGHLLSSQVHCVNHLFGMRNDPATLLAIVNHATGRRFDEVLPAIIDDDGYLSFEFTYHNDELLHEDDRGAGRGTKCTSVDAFLIVRSDNRKTLVPVEWKYTETYRWEDKTNTKRLARYGHLIRESNQLDVPGEGIPQSIYFFEPCYELMRQTLLMEQMIRLGVADDFIHINVIPDGNVALRERVLHFYIPMLKEKTKFVVISPDALLEPMVGKEQYSGLIKYLSQRYW